MPKCRELMTPEPVCCLPGDTIDDVAQLMKQQDVGPVPVCNSEEDRRLVGILTDRDIVIKVVAEGRDPEETRVEQIMSRNVVTCRLDDDVERAIQAMERHQVRRIPVVDSEGRLTGIIAQADIATRMRRPEKTAEMVERVSMPRSAGA